MPANLPVAVHTFLVRGEEVLLMKRRNTGFNDDRYSIPAGRLEEGESVTAALIREAKEEVGVEIMAQDLGMPLFMNHHDERGERIYVFCLVKKWKGVAQNREPEKCSEVVWVSRENLPLNLIEHVKVALETIENGGSYCEFGF